MSQGTALVLLVAAVVALGDRPAGVAAVLAAALGGVGEAIGVAALYRGFAVGAMGVVAPVAATAPLVPVVVGTARGELPGPIGWIGITIAITGIVLVSRSRPAVEAPRTAHGYARLPVVDLTMRAQRADGRQLGCTSQARSMTAAGWSSLADTRGQPATSVRASGSYSIAG